MTILTLIFAIAYLIQVWAYIQLVIDAFSHGENLLGFIHLAALALCVAVGIFFLTIAPQLVFFSFFEAFVFWVFFGMVTIVTAYMGLEAYENHTGKKSAMKTRIDNTLEATGSAIVKTAGIAQLGFGIIKNKISNRFKKAEIVAV